MNDGLVRLNKILAEAYERSGDKKNALKTYQKIAVNQFDDEVNNKIDELSKED